MIAGSSRSAPAAGLLPSGGSLRAVPPLFSLLPGDHIVNLPGIQALLHLNPALHFAMLSWNESFSIFCIKRQTVASFEEPVKKLTGNWGYIDLFRPGRMLAENK